MLIETADMCKAVMLNTSETPADPNKPVLGKDRDDFEEEAEILQMLEEQEKGEMKTLW